MGVLDIPKDLEFIVNLKPPELKRVLVNQHKSLEVQRELINGLKNQIAHQKEQIEALVKEADALKSVILEFVEVSEPEESNG